MNRTLLALGAALSARALLRRRRMIDLRGQSAVITGGSRGLGLVLARELVRQGARVALLARVPEELDAARAELSRAGGDVITVVCDVSDPHDLVHALRAIETERGAIDLLVNNAGTIQVGPFHDMTEEDFADAMAVHFWAPLHAMATVIPMMRRRGGGRIVNIASIGGRVAVPHLAPYCASKFALAGLSDTLRAELAHENIRITTVCPGLMRTGSYLNVLTKGDHRRELSWFALGAGVPLLSMAAERAARRILRATRQGRRELIVGLPARLLVVANAVVPELTARAMALVARAMPRPTEDAAGLAATPGWETPTRWAPSALTALSDRAAEKNHELGPTTMRRPRS